MSKNLSRTMSLLVIVAALYSCVPKKQFLELQEKNNVAMRDRDSLKSLNEELSVKNTEMTSEIEQLNIQRSKLTIAKTNLEDSITFYSRQYNSYKNLYAELMNRQEALVQVNDKETRKLLGELQATKEDLQRREDKLKELELALVSRKRNLDQMKIELDQKNIQLLKLDSTLQLQQKELEDRNAKLMELESVLHAKDSVVLALKNKVQNALMGFENNGLTIQMKNGKVYVSLEEQLLFQFGKTDVDKKGVSALKKLIVVLEQNPDINVMIEGHTDDVGDVNYNWELSAKRANAIVKILLSNSKIAPSRLTAAGRGQFVPIDPGKTEEARRKNRRTEIILTPKLDQLFQILETN